MSIFARLARLSLRQGNSLAGYHLVRNESDHLEKGDDVETSVSDPEPSVVSSDRDLHKRHDLSWRCFRTLSALLPSFLYTRSAQTERLRLRPTAWLDGLRGVAALFVVLHHMSLIWFSWDIHDGWNNWNDHFIQLPIIRLIISGPPNVMIFFVISGYALSCKPLALIQNNQHLKMYQALASSIFRRHPRLFIPAILICAPAPVIAYCGGFSDEGMPGAAISPTNPPRFKSLWGQFGNYITTIMSLSDIYNPNGLNWVYSDSLWTLPIEFKSSLVIFTLLIVLSRCTKRARVLITLCLAFYSFWYFHWGELLFLGGMLVVESSLGAHTTSPASEESRPDNSEFAIDAEFKARQIRWLWQRTPWRIRGFRRMCSIAAFLAALFILSMPEQGRGADDSYGFTTLVKLIPTRFHDSGAADYFWQPLAAVCFVLVINHASFLQRIFTTRLAQYLGRVSFALYLVHMLILHSLGLWLGKYFLEMTGSESYLQYGTGIGLAALVVGCVIIYAADLGSRFVDANAVRFTGWVYNKLCKTPIEG
ncbi:acyltransferase family-domain-containing protein [Nemania sp. FL0916]|nr:acyltransferase family-domain-containing protein [Nemania sp. FL0916]